MILVALAALLSPAFAADPPAPVSGLPAAEATTPAEKLAIAANANQEMRDGVETVQQLVDSAKDKGESAETLQCLNSRLTSLRALVTVSENAETGLKEALGGSDTASTQRANFEYRKITIALNKARSLIGEAQRCSTNPDTTAPLTTVEWEAYLVGDDTFTNTAPTTTPGTTTDLTPFQ
jgi:hypothetical protein